MSDTGDHWSSHPNQTPASVGPTIDPTKGGAQEILNAMLEQFGLGALASWAWTQMVAGASIDAIMAASRTTDVYKQRFIGNAIRQKAGLAPLDEGNYLKYETAYREMLRAHGLDVAKYGSTQAIANSIGGDVSPAEANQRITAATAVRDHVLSNTALGQATAAELQAYYGITPAQLTDLFLDPTAKPEAIAASIQTNDPYTLSQVASTAAIGGAARVQGFNQGLSAEEARRLSLQGVTADQAMQGFGTLWNNRQLLSTITGESGADLTRQQQIDLTFSGDAASADLVAQRAAARVARFREGGSFQTSSKGALGLTTASDTGL